MSFGPDRVLLILERRIILEKVHSISHRSTEKDSRGASIPVVCYAAGFLHVQVPAR